MTAMPPVYRAWRLRPEDKAELDRLGRHCDSPKCRVSATTWTLRTFTRRGQRISVGHFVCDAHGQDFAERHKIEVSSAPAQPDPGHSVPRRPRHKRGGPR